MSRKRSYLSDHDAIIHAFNRAAVQRQLFQCTEDYERFMEILLDALRRTPVSLLVHTLMPTHFHLVLHQHEPKGIPDFLEKVCQPFSHWLNLRSGRKGTNFEGPYKGVRVDDAEGFARLSFYIYRNPVKAGLVPSPEVWPYSSCGSCLDSTSGNINGQALLLALLGGPEGFARFMTQFKASDPDSVKQFLCPEYASIWAAKGKNSHHL